MGFVSGEEPQSQAATDEIRRAPGATRRLAWLVKTPSVGMHAVVMVYGALSCFDLRLFTAEALSACGVLHTTVSPIGPCAMCMAAQQHGCVLLSTSNLT